MGFIWSLSKWLSQLAGVHIHNSCLVRDERPGGTFMRHCSCLSINWIWKLSGKLVYDLCHCVLSFILWSEMSLNDQKFFWDIYIYNSLRQLWSTAIFQHSTSFQWIFYLVARKPSGLPTINVALISPVNMYFPLDFTNAETRMLTFYREHSKIPI